MTLLSTKFTILLRLLPTGCESTAERSYVWMFPPCLLQAPLLQLHFPPPSALQGLKKPASSALNQNNYPKKCTCRACERWRERSTEAITSLQSLLVISLLLWKRTRTAWEQSMCSWHTGIERGGEKRPDVAPVPRKYQWSLKALATLQLLWGLAEHEDRLFIDFVRLHR